ncbi:PKD domain-containing protein [Neolewinella sp.]|uniref:T9SS type A sorting domain-containing protein n=1 Tax=Neolewinella sp. TaxID=2993543 RepID=UPI003B5171D5
MAYFTHLGLLLVASLSMYTTGYAQTSIDYWLEAECTPLNGTGYVTARDFTASNRRYVTLPRGEGEGPTGLADDFLRYPITVDQAVDSTLMLSVYGRLRTILPAVDYFQIRLNGGEWTTLPSILFVADTFAWQPSVQITGLTQGTNLLDVALISVGTELDKLFVTTSTDNQPTGPGPSAANCDAEELNLPPVAIAQALPEGGTAPLEVILDGTYSFDDDGLIESYTWAWNDGGSAFGPTPTVTFVAGTYNVTLTVTDDFGATGTSELTIPVTGLPTEPDPEPRNAFWLEAECAAVGSAWTTLQAGPVSGGQSVVVQELSATASPPADVPANRVRFTLRQALAGSYSLYARIDAPDNGSDSYWVRVNEGPWTRWASGIRQAAGYQWNSYPSGPIALQEGTNFIDFAFREAGTGLDKLHLNQTGKVPTGFGAVATNCSPVGEAATRFAFEAECVQRAGSWRPVSDPTVSGGKYVTYIGPNSVDAPTAAGPADSLTFTVDVTKATTYYGYLRLDAPDLGSNSLWVRIDKGDWIKMNQEVDGTPLLTNGFAWRTLADRGLPVSFELGVGPHTITVANRESGTRLDKVYLSSAALLPDGLGPSAPNCTPPPPVIEFPGLPLGPAVRLPVADLSVYPNPTRSTLSLERMSEYTGPVTIRISDFTGRQLRLLSVDKPGTQLTQTLDLSELPAGMYRLQLLEGQQPTVVPFVKQ